MRTKPQKPWLAFVALAVVGSLVLAACGGRGGVSRADVEEMVRAEMDQAPAQLPATPPALTSAEVEEMVAAAVADMPGPGQGLSRAEVEEMVAAAVADMPGPGQGLSRAEVEETVRAAVAGMPRPEPGLSSAEVEEMVAAAVAGMPGPEPGLSRAEVEEIVRAVVFSVPSKSAPAEYTRHVVANAVARYGAQGLEATLAHYNSPRSGDGQWYVFIIDEDDLVIAHPDPERLGLDLKGWVGTDVNGYEFGPEMLSATEEGKWVSYVFRNPESGGLGAGDFELKNVWVERHDGLLFASGWYIDANEFTRMLVSLAVDKYRELGLAGTMAYFAGPDSVLAGLEAAIDYYNTAETVDGRWFAFIGDPDGVIVGHSDVSMIGRNVSDLFGAETFQVTGPGGWVESESLRVYVAEHGGVVFGSGWLRD